MTSTPFDKRLMELQLLGRPEDKEELAMLEEYVQWKAANGPKVFEDKEKIRLRLNGSNYDWILDGQPRKERYDPRSIENGRGNATVRSGNKPR